MYAHKHKSTLKMVSVLSLILVFQGCKKNREPGPDLLASYAYVAHEADGTLFFNHPDNPFLKPIPVNYAVHPNSEQMIALIRQSAGADERNTYIATGPFGSVVYAAINHPPKKDIKITMYNRPQGKTTMCNIPVIEGSEAAAGSDKHYMVIDRDKHCLSEFWIFQRSKAASGNAMNLDEDGIYADGRSTVAAGWSQLQGLIWPKEIRQGKIDHALSFAVPVTNANGFVPPATHNDGTLSNNPYAIPQGTLVRIRPSVDIDSIPNLGPVEKAVYKALQTYGMYCGDTNGAGVGIRGIARNCLPDDAYPSDMKFNETYGNYYLKNFPFDLMEVVYTGPLTPSSSKPYINRSCAQWK